MEILTVLYDKSEIGSVQASRVKKAVIVGLPNTGKSQIFNNLTGEYTTVANYPGTTIEMKRTVAKINGRLFEVIDTPSLDSLYVHSEEELAVRDMILSEKPDVLIQCIDTNQYKQSLMLTADLLELDIPMVVVLNSIDESARKGVWVDSTELERMLGVPVVESMALSGLGKDELKKAITVARQGKTRLTFTTRIENEIAGIEACLPDEFSFKRKIAVLLLLNDNFIERYLRTKLTKEKTASLMEKANGVRRFVNDNIRAVIYGRYSEWVDYVSSISVRKHKIAAQGFYDHFARLCRHPLAGVPIVFLFMAFVYLAIVHLSLPFEKILTARVVNPTVSFINGLGLPVFWDELLVGKHGLLTLGIFNAICTVLPILSVFFFIFGFFEDCGYIANFCVLSKRLFEKIGITGKAITSLILGFACKTMATLNARGLASHKEKLITVFIVTLAIPCSSQLGLSVAILGKMGISAFLIAFGTLALFGLGAGLSLNALIKEEVDTCFIQMLPPMRFPDIRAVCVKTYHRIYDFLKESMPIFIAAAAMLFVLDKAGVLDLTKKILSPLIVNWMGLPRDMLDVFMLALATRAASAGLILQMGDAGTLSYIQAIVAVVITTSFFPCIPNLIAIAREMGIKAAVVISALACFAAFFLAGVLHWILVFASKY